MNGATRLGLRAKDSSDSCDLGAFTESERVVRSWSGFQCGTARTVRYATIEERRAAAFHADVQRCTELRFSRSQEEFSRFQSRQSAGVGTIRRRHVIWSSKVVEGRPWVYYTCPRRLGTIRSSPARGMRHRHR